MWYCVCMVLREVLLGQKGYFSLKAMHGGKGTNCPFMTPEVLGVVQRKQIDYQEHGKKF